MSSHIPNDIKKGHLVESVVNGQTKRHLWGHIPKGKEVAPLAREDMSSGPPSAVPEASRWYIVKPHGLNSLHMHKLRRGSR